MLKIAHIGIVATVLLAFWQAPFQHRHEADPDHEHARGLAHIHLGEHEDHHQQGAVFEDADHGADAHLVDWLASYRTNVVKVVPSLPEQIFVFQVSSHETPLVAIVKHNHDPPGQSRLLPRAPPV